MRLQTLQTYISEFNLYLRKDRGYFIKQYDFLDHFRKSWTFQTDDFQSMYDHSLQSTVTQRWWKAENYRPKEIMLKLIDIEPEYARQIFKDLFNENKDIEGRVDRFIFYCDELLAIYRKKYRGRIDNHHYHDAQIISLYLAAMYPTEYALYPGREIFVKAFEKLAVNVDPNIDNVSRFFKLAKVIRKYLNADTGITATLNQNGIDPSSLVTTHEFVKYIAQALPPGS